MSDLLPGDVVRSLPDQSMVLDTCVRTANSVQQHKGLLQGSGVAYHALTESFGLADASQSILAPASAVVQGTLLDIRFTLEGEKKVPLSLTYHHTREWRHTRKHRRLTLLFYGAFMCICSVNYGWNASVVIAPAEVLSDLRSFGVTELTLLTQDAFLATPSAAPLVAAAHFFMLMGSRRDIQAALAHARALNLLRRPSVFLSFFLSFFRFLFLFLFRFLFLFLFHTYL